MLVSLKASLSLYEVKSTIEKSHFLTSVQPRVHVSDGVPWALGGIKAFNKCK